MDAEIGKVVRIYTVGQRLDFNHEVYRVSKFQLHFAFRTFFPSYGLCVQQREWQMWSAEISRRKIFESSKLARLQTTL